MNEREILEQSIDEHQEAINKAREKLTDLEVTYSRGDRFTHCEKKYILGLINRKVAMVSLEDGIEWQGYSFAVFNIFKITQRELDNIADDTFTRYWDNCKKVYTDGRSQ